MKKGIISLVFTGIYFKFNEETKERSVRYNYVVVDGDVKQYTADRELAGFLSLQDNGEHAGKPRFASLKDLGQTSELNRVEKKDGSHDWYTDDTEALLIESAVKALPEYAKQAYGKELAMDAIATARATAQRIKAMKASASKVEEDITKP